MARARSGPCPQGTPSHDRRHRLCWWFRIPVLVDPSVIMASPESGRDIWPHGERNKYPSRRRPGKVFHSAGASIGFEAEGASQAPDANVTLAQPIVPILKVDGTIVTRTSSIIDYPSFSSEALRMFGAALNDNVTNYTAVGSGSSVPTGIITAMANQTSPPGSRHCHHARHGRGERHPQGVRRLARALSGQCELDAQSEHGPGRLCPRGALRHERPRAARLDSCDTRSAGSIVGPPGHRVLLQHLVHVEHRHSQLGRGGDFSRF